MLKSNEIYQRNLVDNNFEIEYEYYDCIIGFEVINGIGDSIILFSIINKIIAENYKNPYIILFCNLDYDYEYDKIFAMKYNQVLKPKRVASFKTNAFELFQNIDINIYSSEKYFWSFWDILSYNLDFPIPKIDLKIKPKDISEYKNKWPSVCSVQIYTYNKERYAGIQNSIDFIYSRWMHIFSSNAEKLFLLLGSGKDSKIGQFNLPNVISLLGKTSVKETCEIILACDHHYAIESWTQVFCSAARQPNTQYWDFESFPPYRPMVNF